MKHGVCFFGYSALLDKILSFGDHVNKTKQF